MRRIMSTDLVIVESPAKARTIGKILGKDYSVLSSMGHIRDLPQRKLGVDLENGFTPTYQQNKSRKNVIQALTKAIKQADSAYLATDPDREGEAIAWHLYELLRKHNADVDFRRVTFHEITKQAVLNAFTEPGELDMNRVDAQQARRILDRIVGYQVSPLLWKQVDSKAKSAGRVQSVALRLICEREREIEAFEPREYWNFDAEFTENKNQQKFVAKLSEVDGAKVDVGDTATAEAIHNDARQAAYTVTKIKDTPKIRRPGPPFITSTLQQAASTNLRLSAKQTMMVAQQLYEGIDTGNGPTGLITYMRTDSVTISEESRTAAYAFIREKFGADYIPEKPNRYKSKKSAQEAHEAIRPTDVGLTPKAASSFLDGRQLKLYRLIWNRFMASQMAPARTIQHSVELRDNNGGDGSRFKFRAGAVEIIFQGYLKVYDLKDVESPDDDDAGATLPPLSVGDACDLKDLKKTQKFTEPPPRFSEGSLVRELENNGVGRPSTYASIVATIQEREYVVKEKRQLAPTALGKTVCDYLVTNMPLLFEVKFTANMEDKLDEIEQGKLEWQKMMSMFYGDFTNWLESVQGSSVPDTDKIKTIMTVFPEDFPWPEPPKKKVRGYDDRRFYNSLKKQLDDGKRLSDKQWNALLTVIARFADQLPTLDAVAEETGFGTTIAEYRERLAARQRQATEADSVICSLCDALEGVKEWEKSVGKGKRVYDDKKFFTSLAQQARSGKVLSPAQARALKNLVRKYSEQIPNFSDIQCHVEAEDELPDENDESYREAQALLTLTQDITAWKEPTGKSARKFDEQAFVASLSKQFDQRKKLSGRQIYSLKKVIRNHKEQINDYDTRTADLKF